MFRVQVLRGQGSRFQGSGFAAMKSPIACSNVELEAPNAIRARVLEAHTPR